MPLAGLHVHAAAQDGARQEEAHALHQDERRHLQRARAGPQSTHADGLVRQVARQTDAERVADAGDDGQHVRLARRQHDGPDAAQVHASAARVEETLSCCGVWSFDPAAE